MASATMTVSVSQAEKIRDAVLALERTSARDLAALLHKPT
jgi:hypothetical protein